MSNDQDLQFEGLGLSQPVLQALDMKGYTTPTPIQAQAIPPVLEGRDLLGIAQTGTGKTAAFMLPGIDRLREADLQTPFKSCRMLVLAPTRELAGQIAQSAKDYGAMAGMKVQSIVGGTSVSRDRNKLHRGTDILVATPGRLLDLVEQKAFRLDGVEILILDEADQMLDLGFIHALRQINDLVPDERQTLFFSATMPKQIKELVRNYCRNPVQVSVTPAATTAERIDQYLFMVQQNEKQSLLEMVLSGRHPVPGNLERVLIFTRTKHGADRVVKKLNQSGIGANAIHGNKSQPQRQRALDEFKRGKTTVLVATDVAARGIDIPGVSHVINYELPNVPEQYVHRIGRTARAGKEGVAIAFCAEDERSYLKDIRKVTDAEFERLPLPEKFRDVVEGVGPTKPPPKQQRQRVHARPKNGPGGDRDRKPSRNQGRKHPDRAGRPRRDGQGGGQGNGGNRWDSGDSRDGGQRRESGSRESGRRDAGGREAGEGSRRDARPRRSSNDGGYQGGQRRDSGGGRDGGQRRDSGQRRGSSEGGHNGGQRRSFGEGGQRRTSGEGGHNGGQRRDSGSRSGGRPEGRSGGGRPGGHSGGRTDNRSGGHSGGRSEGRSDNRSENRSGGRPDNRSGGRADGRSDNRSGARSGGRPGGPGGRPGGRSGGRSGPGQGSGPNRNRRRPG